MQTFFQHACGWIGLCIALSFGTASAQEHPDAGTVPSAFPAVISGFSFGSTAAKVRAACVAGGGRARSVGRNAIFCTGVQSPLMFRAAAMVSLCRGRVCAIDITPAYQTTDGEWIDTWNAARAALEQQYGLSHRLSTGPESCIEVTVRERHFDCFRQTPNTAVTDRWAPQGGQIELILTVTEDGPGLLVRYRAQPTRR